MFLIILSFMFFDAASKGDFEVNKKYVFSIENKDTVIDFKDLKVRRNGKVGGYIRNDSKFAIKWVWFDFDRFDKNGKHSKVSYSYPQILVQNLNVNEWIKLKGISLVGVKWFKSYNFGPIVSVEFEESFYRNYAKSLNLPFLIKRIEAGLDKSIDQNQGYIELLNFSNKAIKSVNVSFQPINALGEKVFSYTPVNVELLNSDCSNINLNKYFKIWDFENICILPDLIQINYIDGTVHEIAEDQINKYLYLPTTNLYPTKNYSAIECLQKININRPTLD